MERRATRRFDKFFTRLDSHKLILYMMVVVLAALFWSGECTFGIQKGAPHCYTFTNMGLHLARPAAADPGNKSYNRTGLFTAYTSRVQETDSTPYITSDGTDLRKIDFCVVAHNYLPIDSIIEIEQIGECVVKDRMGRGGKNRFDLYFRNELKHARKFGAKKLKYRIVR